MTTFFRLFNTCIFSFILTTELSSQTLFKDLWPGSTDGFPYYLCPTEDLLFFRCENANAGRELWTTDGNANNTSLLKDIYPGSSNSSPTGIFAYGNEVLFSADNGTNGVELWISDGTTNGTTLLKDLYSGGNWSDSHPYSFTEINGKVVFVAEISSYQHEPMVTDGTPGGTQVLKDIYPGSAGSLSDLYSRFYKCNGYLYFVAVNQNNGAELWRTNGTSGGTSLVKDINSGASYGLDVKRGMGSYNNEIYFPANNGSNNGYELWKSDGTTNGTVLVKDINPGSGSSDPKDFCVANGILYFNADDGVHGDELWRTDGTASGTYMVKDIYPGAGNSSPSQLTELDGKIYFEAEGQNIGHELYTSDGTSAGTYLFKNFYYLSDSYPSMALKYADRLYYTANIPNTYGRELWVVDGDSANTQMVKDIWPGTASSTPSFLVEFKEKIYFQAKSSNTGVEMWVFDPCNGIGVNSSLTHQGDSLISTNVDSKYAWYYCGEEGEILMEGENDSIFSPELSGKYKVKVTTQGCIKSSACTYVDKNLMLQTAFDSIYIDPISNATYQWYDCDLMTIVQGQTSPIIKPQAGKYALIISLNGVVDTTDCIDFAIDGIASHMQSQKFVQVFPNPTENILNMQTVENDDFEAILFSIDGKKLLTATISNKGSIDVSGLERGTYILRIANSNRIQIERIILQ